MGINILMFLAIIVLNLYSGMLSFSFYGTSKKNHFKFKHAYTSNVLLILQSVLAIYYLVSGNDRFNDARWIAFSLAELSMFYFVLRSYPNRHFELIITAVFMVVLLMSTLWLNVWYNVLIVLILVILSLLSRDEILSKWFSISFLLYGMTSIIPNLFGFTQFESILMGLLFTIHFTIGIRRLYVKEKTDEHLKDLIKQGKL